MSRLRLDMDPANVDTDGLADGITGAGPWAAGDFVRTTTPDGLAHQLNLTSTANLSAINITLTGTDADDNVIAEVIAGPNNNTVETTKYFKTLTGVSAASTLGANTLDIGWVDEIVSRTVDLNPDFPTYVQLDVTGTLSIDTDWSAKMRLGHPVVEQASIPWMDGSGIAATLDAETADSATVVAVPAGYGCMRFRWNSYTDTAEAQAYINNRER